MQICFLELFSEAMSSTTTSEQSEDFLSSGDDYVPDSDSSSDASSIVFNPLVACKYQVSVMKVLANFMSGRSWFIPHPSRTYVFKFGNLVDAHSGVWHYGLRAVAGRLSIL